MATLAFGLVARHRRVVLSQAQRGFGALGDLLAVLLFVYIAATLSWSQLVTGLGLGLGLVAVRAAAKVAGVTAFARVSGLTWRKGLLTGVALTPFSAFVILVLEQTRFLGVNLVDQLPPLAAAALILEILGPSSPSAPSSGRTRWRTRPPRPPGGPRQRRPRPRPPPRPRPRRRSRPVRRWPGARRARMPLEPFKLSKPLSLGVELELQLVSLSDFDLTSASPDMLELLGRAPFPGSVVPEITQSMIEVSTDVQPGHAPLLAQLGLIRDALVRAGDRLNVGVCGGGTHPFQLWSERKVFAKPRFEQVSALYGYLAKQFTIFGQHVHVGCAGGDDALFLLHALNRYVPHFIALSAASPFVQGRDTLFNSARLNSVFAFPLSGRAPFFLRWEEFERQYFAKMEHTGVVKSMKDFYWDLRPKPEYGTIELRVCDTPLSVERAAALAGYLQAICAHLLEREEEGPAEDDYLVYNYNRFQACRFGLDGALVHPKSYQQRPLREDILGTLELVRDHGDVLECLPALEHVHALAREGSDASWLRREHAERGSVEGMVEAALTRFRA